MEVGIELKMLKRVGKAPTFYPKTCQNLAKGGERDHHIWLDLAVTSASAACRWSTKVRHQLAMPRDMVGDFQQWLWWHDIKGEGKGKVGVGVGEREDCGGREASRI